MTLSSKKKLLLTYKSWPKSYGFKQFQWHAVQENGHDKKHQVPFEQFDFKITIVQIVIILSFSYSSNRLVKGWSTSPLTFPVHDVFKKELEAKWFQTLNVAYLNLDRNQALVTVNVRFPYKRALIDTIMKYWR